MSRKRSSWSGKLLLLAIFALLVFLIVTGEISLKELVDK